MLQTCKFLAGKEEACWTFYLNCKLAKFSVDKAVRQVLKQVKIQYIM